MKQPTVQPTTTVVMSARDLIRLALGREPLVVPLEQREGVYVHSFICKNTVGERLCNLHFMTFSWQADRHRVGTIKCPECGGSETFLHYRAVLSESPDLKLLYEGDPRTEIYAVFPFPGSKLLDDTNVR